MPTVAELYDDEQEPQAPPTLQTGLQGATRIIPGAYPGTFPEVPEWITDRLTDVRDTVGNWVDRLLAPRGASSVFTPRGVPPEPVTMRSRVGTLYQTSPSAQDAVDIAKAL